MATANEPAYWGTVLEDILAQEFSKRTGYVVRRAPESISHPDRPWQLGSIDRFFYVPKPGQTVRRLESEISAGLRAPDGILEIKTTTLRKESEWQNGPPMYPYCQVQHYLSVTGYRSAWIVVLIGGQTFKMFPVERDEAFIAEMVARETDFWRRVEERDPPPVDGLPSTSLALSGVAATPEKIVDLEPEAMGYFVRMADLHEQISHLEQEREVLVNTVKQVMGDAERATLGGAVVVTWKTQRRAHVDIKSLRLEEPDLVQGHTYQTESRTFKVNIDDELLQTFRDLVDVDDHPGDETLVARNPDEHGVRTGEEGDL
jgi:predicted phage-related endonuclease